MAAHPRIDAEKYFTEIRRYENVPWTYRNILCFMKDGPREDRHEWLGASYVAGFLAVCSTCRKPPIFVYNKCVFCSNVFVRDFVHHKYCSLFPTCWDCIPKLEWDYCPDHTIPLYRSPADLEPIREPVNLNPRKFSTDDLDNFAKEFGLEL